MTSNPQRHILNLMEIVAVDKDRIESLQAEIASLRRRIELQDATINRQAAQLEQYAKMLDDERAKIAQLRVQLNAVPVDCIRRYYAFTHYDAPAANDAGYTTQQFDSDDMWIRIWLESLEDAA